MDNSASHWSTKNTWSIKISWMVNMTCKHDMALCNKSRVPKGMIFTLAVLLNKFSVSVISKCCLRTLKIILSFQLKIKTWRSTNSSEWVNMAGISPYSLLNESGFQLVLRLAGNRVIISLEGSILNFEYWRWPDANREKKKKIERFSFLGIHFDRRDFRLFPEPRKKTVLSFSNSGSGTIQVSLNRFLKINGS